MIQLEEYQSLDVDLDDSDLAHLLSMVKGESEEDGAKVIQSITPTKRPNAYRVRLGHFVGRLGLPSGRTIDVRSRFPLGRVVDLIRYSGRLPIRLDKLAPAMDAEDFLIDVIALAYSREVGRLLAFGLAKGYRDYRFDRPPYPGVPDLVAHLGRHGGRPDKLVTRARRITIDIELNRALAAAIEVLSRVPLAREPTRMLMSVYPAFGRVARVPTRADSLARLELTRLTVRYRESLALAEVILRAQSLAGEGVAMAGSSVLFNMAKVWESCVAKWAQSLWGEGCQVTEQYPFDISAGGELRASADVVVQRDGELVAVYDAKYKWPGTAPSLGDVYQSVTYCTRLGLSEATLVYPSPSREKSYRIGGVTIRTVGLDMGLLLGGSVSTKVS